MWLCRISVPKVRLSHKNELRRAKKNAKTFETEYEYSFHHHTCVWYTPHHIQRQCCCEMSWAREASRSERVFVSATCPATPVILPYSRHAPVILPWFRHTHEREIGLFWYDTNLKALCLCRTAVSKNLSAVVAGFFFFFLFATNCSMFAHLLPHEFSLKHHFKNVGL